MLGPIKKSKPGCQYVLYVIDQFSRWADVIPMGRITAKNTCEALLQIFARTSIPTTVISDNGCNFTSALTLEFEKMMGCSPKFVSPYHPEANGLVERFIGTFRNMLHHVIIADEHQWDKLIPFVIWAYEEVPNSTTVLIN